MNVQLVCFISQTFTHLLIQHKHMHTQSLTHTRTHRERNKQKKPEKNNDTKKILRTHKYCLKLGFSFFDLKVRS